ncbi:hypothetical protein K438DRAFT_254177 [Mycena galopus ATCC 62051]|nr:hypothetical protein K438DRAFT_254177 [Mycena galopus ATCC 62051]
MRNSTAMLARWESGCWDASWALVHRTVEKCIQLGHQHRSQGRKEDEYEALQLLGSILSKTFLRTHQDFSAHSKFCVHQRAQWAVGCPLCYRKGSNFINSLLGEAGDHLSQTSARLLLTGTGPVHCIFLIQPRLETSCPTSTKNWIERAPSPPAVPGPTQRTLRRCCAICFSSYRWLGFQNDT